MKIILNIATHGDEKIGYRVAEKIRKLNLNKNILRIQIANPKASKLNKRFIDQDLNRSFPGRKNGNYEERLAYRLTPLIKSADIVIDLHSTTSELRDALIVTKLDSKALEYVKIIKPKYVLVMKATKHNALISQAKVGLAFEYGKDGDQNVINKVVIGLKRLFRHLQSVENKQSSPKVSTTYFNVISTVKKPRGYKLLRKIKNYKLVNKGETYATK